MNNLLEAYIKELEKSKTAGQFDSVISVLEEMMHREKFEPEIIQKVREKAKYFNNKFSDASTIENMIKAKESLILYLKQVSNERNTNPLKDDQNNLKLYLKNFYVFLEAFKEIRPDKRATLTAEILKAIQINNEYDLQHLLYAFLKPIYSDTRKEVTEDSGRGAIRSDIKIPSLNSIIEAKCTRKSMSLNKLIEELESDIVHYSADFIYFYIYDKEKIIKDKQNFGAYFSKEFDGKKIDVTILQPVMM